MRIDDTLKVFLDTPVEIQQSVLKLIPVTELLHLLEGLPPTIRHTALDSFTQLTLVVSDRYTNPSTCQLRYGSVEFNLLIRVLQHYSGVTIKSLELHGYRHDDKLNLLISRSGSTTISANCLLDVLKNDDLNRNLSGKIRAVWFNSPESTLLNWLTKVKFFGVTSLQFNFLSAYITFDKLKRLLQVFPNVRSVKFQRSCDSTLLLRNQLTQDYSYKIESCLGHLETYLEDFNNIEPLDFLVQKLSIYTPEFQRHVDIGPLAFAGMLTDLDLVIYKSAKLEVSGILPNIKKLEICDLTLPDRRTLDIGKQFPNLQTLTLVKCTIDPNVLVSTIPQTLKNLTYNTCVHINDDPLVIDLKNLSYLSIKGSDVIMKDLKFLDTLSLAYYRSMDLQIPDFTHLRSLSITGGELPSKFPVSLTELKIMFHEKTFGNVIFPEHLEDLSIQFNECLCIDLDSTNLSKTKLKSLNITLWYSFLNENLSVLPVTLNNFILTISKRIDYEFKCEIRKTVSLLEDLNWNNRMNALTLIIDNRVIVPKHWVKRNLTDYETIMKNANLNTVFPVSYIEVHDNDQMVKTLIGYR